MFHPFDLDPRRTFEQQNSCLVRMMRYFGLFVAVLILGASAQVNLPYAIDCDSQMCAYDLRPWCMESGRIVFGHCDLKKAICQEGEKLASSQNCLAVSR